MATCYRRVPLAESGLPGIRAVSVFPPGDVEGLSRSGKGRSKRHPFRLYPLCQNDMSRKQNHIPGQLQYSGVFPDLSSLWGALPRYAECGIPRFLIPFYTGAACECSLRLRRAGSGVKPARRISERRLHTCLSIAFIIPFLTLFSPTACLCRRMRAELWRIFLKGDASRSFLWGICGTGKPFSGGSA